MSKGLKSNARSQKSGGPNPKFRVTEGLITKATRYMKTKVN
jgi:hypothetical protein